MIICADDYGLREDIDRAILELCALGKLTAVSCMVALSRCDRPLLDGLLAYQPKLDIGLHLCLTDEDLPLAITPSEGKLPVFKHLFLSSVLGRIQHRDVSRLIQCQYELFLAKCGRPPDHIDGHLHSHQLPTVRAAMVEFVASLPAKTRPYVRNTWAPVRVIRRKKLPWMKAAVIGVFGLRMQRLLQNAGLPTNQGFAGIYDFKQWPRYPEYLPKFTDCLPGPNGILVVHPGMNEDWRRQEFECLRNDAFRKKPLNRFRP